MLLNLLLLTGSLLKVCSGHSDGEDSQIPLSLKHASEVGIPPETGDVAKAQDDVPVPPLTVTPLSVSGPSDNRADLVFFSDGYLQEEYDKFLEDAKRLAEDISGNQTFYTVRPLMNFWAAFSPSNESGVGVGGKPKDTPFGLYRDGTELRAVYYAKPEVARAACDSLGTQCDYPILLGNDPLYGGLGGDFTVITSSIANGPLVLRHELGHSIIDVGEEYDGGPEYFGVNAAKDLSQPTPWEQWITDPHNTVSHRRVERSNMPMQQYPWTLLNTTTSWSINFTSSGQYSRHLVRFSLSGLPEASDLSVELDGVNLGWVPKEGIDVDRWHYDLHQDSGLASGQHELKFTLLNGDRQGIAQLCSCEILEFGTEEEFISEPGYYGLFPTFSDKNVTSYRPTNEDCLMRVVTSPNFCKVCTEGLWIYLLRNISLVDSVAQGCKRTGHGSVERTLNATLVPLAQFRDGTPPNGVKESYTITWTKDGKVLEAFTNKTLLTVPDQSAIGSYNLKVKFSTDEVRLDKDNVLEDEYDFTVQKRCKT